MASKYGGCDLRGFDYALQNGPRCGPYCPYVVHVLSSSASGKLQLYQRFITSIVSIVKFYVSFQLSAVFSAYCISFKKTHMYLLLFDFDHTTYIDTIFSTYNKKSLELWLCIIFRIAGIIRGNVSRRNTVCAMGSNSTVKFLF